MTLCKHHIDANKQNNNKGNFLFLSARKHRQLHAKGYDYLVELGLIKEYIQWFDKKFSLK